MACSQWLHLFEAPPGFDSPFLRENHGPYQDFDRNPRAYPEVITLIRGWNKFLPAKTEGSVQLGKIRFPLVLLADCTLHHPPQLQPINPGFLPPNVSQHHLTGRRLAKSQDLAYSLYSRLLSPFSNVVAFYGDEHGSLAPILHALASWISFTPDGAWFWPRPAVLIFLPSWPGNKPVDIHEELAIEILQNFNHEKILSFRAAVSAWKKCFASVTAIIEPTGDIRLQRMISESARIQQEKMTSGVAFNAYHFKRFFRAACAHFAKAEIAPLNLLDISRVDNPSLDEIRFHVEQVAGAAKRKEGRPDIAIKLIASALVLDSYGQMKHGRHLLLSLCQHTNPKSFPC